MLRIDAHAHFVSESLLVAVERDGERYGIRISRGHDGRRLCVLGSAPVRPFPKPLTDLDARWTRMEQQGVDVQVVSGWNEFFGYELEPADGRWWSRLQNESLAETVAESDDRLVGLAALPMQDPSAAVHELRYAADKLGLRGAIIGTNVRGANLDDPELEPFWKGAADVGAALVVHPGGPTIAGGDRLSRHFLSNLVGNPTETTIAGASLLFGGVVDRFPDIRFMLVHGGGFLPYQLGRLRKGFDVRPEIPKDPSHDPLKQASRFFYDTILHASPALELLIDVAGPSRIVFGTDFPFEMSESRSVHDVLSVGFLGGDSRAAIAGGNAAALFGVAAS
jgi:aminocarboxymuconate-semialdehyde decarboxylase